MSHGRAAAASCVACAVCTSAVGPPMGGASCTPCAGGGPPGTGMPPPPPAPQAEPLVAWPAPVPGSLAVEVPLH